MAYSYPTDTLLYAWLMAMMFFFISSGWAAGDVSLSAYIQSSLSYTKFHDQLNPLSAVMAFLYTSYIVIYACLSYGLGRVIDAYMANRDPHGFLFYISGVMMTIACVVIMASTFVPKGSCKVNPTMEELSPDESGERDKLVIN